MLTMLDAFVEDMTTRIDRLSKRSIAALYWACSSALVPVYRKWAAGTGAQAEPILIAALTAGYQFVVSGREPADKRELLQALEVSAPPGDLLYTADKSLETAAQDCWICGDIAIRVLVDDGYSAGGAIEYSLEPVLQHASERLFGVLQVGSGPDEYREIEAVMSEPDVSAATDFVQWAVDFLEDRPAPAAEDLELMGQRATVLRPEGLAYPG
jgi:hypothetical protein